jgi:hypothetical protein
MDLAERRQLAPGLKKPHCCSKTVALAFQTMKQDGLVLISLLGSVGKKRAILQEHV